MYIQSTDYIGFNTPVIIKGIEIKRRFFFKYYIITLEVKQKFYINVNETIYTDKLILEQRFPAFILGISQLPKEVMVLTPNYYSTQAKSKKHIIGIVDLYDGLPTYED